MGGLGNGRRGGRSPPLMIAALIACILVLGFNYWVSSSRNLELQTKLYELEGQVRRGAAERGAVELKKNEFQGEIQRQKEQINHIENVYKRQLEGAQSTCIQDKATLQQNISSSTKTIQELKGQLNQLNDDLGKLQKELQSCQGNINTLNNKLTYDMTHCHSQVLSQKELCDERMAAAKLEFEKKMEKLVPPPGVSSQQENAVDGAVKDSKPVQIVPDGAQPATVVSHTPGLSEPKENEPSELLTNDIIVEKVELPLAKDLSKAETVPPAAAAKQDILPQEGAVRADESEGETNKLLNNNLTEDKDVEVMDAHEEGAQTEETDPGMEGMLIGQGKADETLNGQNLQEPEEYDGEEQVVGGVDMEKQQQNKQSENIDKDMEEELADYNGDDENEGEFEADKQAELAQI
ncbi:Golgi membrane protein 1 isoform X1 [Acanthochromis polyacanthus]|uniref:Golgi membrane protein 1 isoform X1 n=1 Tax=Acanthochromis polyacanthus TaxID=80966 RepID=UPI000B8F5DD7|nr:Golgi membrane protein 1 isoform X1 [Acanthochromis polyacanthus]